MRGLGASASHPAVIDGVRSPPTSRAADALRIERATSVGHSLGGYVELAFHRLFAKRVGGLGLIGRACGATMMRAHAPAAEALAERG